VEGGHKAIMYSRISGIDSEVLTEGFHLRVPWLQRPVIYDVRSKYKTFASPTGTKDLQTVNISVRVLYRPDDARLMEIYRTLGTNFDDRLLYSIVPEVLKSVVATFNAAQLTTMRTDVSRMISDELIRRAALFNVKLEDVSITELSFGPEYTAAVEAKQIALQNAKRAELYVEKARQERQQKIVEAQGEAEAAQLIGQAMKNNPGFLNLRKIEAAREIANTVANSQNRVFLDANALMLDVNNAEVSMDATKATAGKSSMW